VEQALVIGDGVQLLQLPTRYSSCGASTCDW
jgi:hypothetical protein